LIRENPAEAERMVERLAALLRFSLDSSGARLVPLSRELAIVRSYLEIEKVRFGHRLSYRIEADPLLNGLEAPPLSVQTLVENSVKFAVTPRREGAEMWCA
jgi:sensor histidine kinase YesM